jgi:hypothetical protein
MLVSFRIPSRHLTFVSSGPRVHPLRHSPTPQKPFHNLPCRFFITSTHHRRPRETSPSSSLSMPVGPKSFYSTYTYITSKMVSNPPGKCCYQGVLHEGEPKGELSQLGDFEIYTAKPADGNMDYGVLMYVLSSIVHYNTTGALPKPSWSPDPAQCQFPPSHHLTQPQIFI